ncbi:hypothetical protein H0R94_01800 [Treponema socranskii]|uniref:Ig-like domain-containing protein n=1 Tax=Treponema socranskii TaxID=53419 RepID=UPI003D8D295F
MNFLNTKSTISKNYGLLTAVFFIVTACILTVLSCEVGLGASVDTVPPSNAITYPPKNAVVRSTFVIAGTCSDDTSVGSVTVSITNTDTKTAYGPFQADLAEDKKSWSIRLNKEKRDVPNHPYAGWDFPDGKYSVTAYATDASGRNSDITANAFTIDNTPPVLILTSPSSSGTLTPDKFGRTISITGTYAEDTDNKIAEMKVLLFKKSGASKIGEITLTDIDHMSDNNKYVIAQYFSTIPSNPDEQRLFDNYKTIFGETEVNNYTTSGTAADLPVYMTLLLSDGARVYDDPSNPAGSGPGNRTTHYYRNTDEIIDNFTKENAAYPMSIFEIKDFLNGTSIKYTEDTAVTNIKNALDEAKSAEYKAEDTPLADTTKATTLSVNPKANPTFIVAGYEKTASGSSAYNSNGFPYCTDGAPFNITISSGPDNVPIQYTGDKVTIYSVPADTDGNYSSSLPADWTTSTEPPSSLPAGWVKIANITGESNKAAYTMTANPVAPATSYGLSPNTLYRFAVWGRDINGIAIEDGTGGPYVCVVKPTGNVPEIKDFKAEVNTSPAVNVGGKYVNKAMTGKTLTVTAKVSDGVSLGLTDAAIQANIIAKAKLDGTDYTASDLTITKEPSVDKKSAVVKFKLTIPSDGTKDGKWTFTLSATNKDGVSSDTQSIELTIDTVDPTWKTANTPNKAPYISPTQADNWYNRTALQVKALAEDSGSGIDKLQYKLSTSSDWNEVGNGNFAFTCDSTFNGSVTARATDKAGNYIESIHTVQIDTASPDMCTLGTVDGQSGVTAKLVNGTNDVTFTFTASDASGGSGLNPAEIKVVKIGNTLLSPAIVPTESGGTYTATIPKAQLADGAVTVRLTDNAGNTADFPLFTLQLDNTLPTVKINTPAANATVNKTITVSGTAFDSREIANKVEVFIKTGSGANDWEVYKTTPVITPITDGVWTFTLDTNKTEAPASGGIGTYDSDGAANGRQLTFKISAKDAAGNVGAKEVTVTVDQNADRPVIRFTNLPLNVMTAATPAWFKGSDTIYGGITDDDGEVTSFQYSTDNGTHWNSIPVSGGSWNLTLPDGPKTILFKVTDAKAGEFISSMTASTSAPKLTDGTNTFGEGAHPDSTLYLKVDTLVPEMRNIQISSDGVNWSDDFKTVGVNPLMLGGTNTSFFIRFEAKDANGIDENNLSVTTSNLSRDNGTPVPEHTYTTATIVPPASGKTHVNVTSVSMADGWKQYTFSDIPYYNALPDKGSGTMKLEIVATDTAGNTSPIMREAKVDNTAPKVEFSSPITKTSSGISPTKGNTHVRGEIDDSKATVEYAISPNGEKSPDRDTSSDNSYTYVDALGVEHTATISSFDPNKTAYAQVKDVSTRWYVMFDGDTDPGATGTHSKKLDDWLVDLGIKTDTTYDKITKLYVWIKATDAYGNTKEDKFPIWHDPQGDRPSVTIDYPTNNARLGGTVRLAGNATDNNAPTAVFVQILRDENNIPSGSPEVADLNYWQSTGYSVYLMSGSGSGGSAWSGTLASGKTAADYGILTTLTGGSWSLPINEHDELNPSGNTPNNVKITAYAYDGSDNKSLPKSVNVTFDKNNPVFGNIQLVKSDDETIAHNNTNSAQQATASGGTYSVKDTWYIYGSVTDADSIKKLTIKDNGTPHQLITGGAAASSGGRWDVKNTGNTAEFKYKLNTASGVGECPIEIEAYDATSQEYNSKYTLTIKYDNQAPVLLMPSETGYNIDANISQSDSFYTFGSKVREDAVGGKAQSGFKRLAFFFMRRSSASNAVIYDPMLEKSDSLNKHAWNAAGISYGSGLYWKEYGGVSWNAGNPAVLTFTTDKNVHAGGLVQVNGAIYRIESVSTAGVIRLDSGLAAAPQDGKVKVALALIVDHLSAEGGASSLEADGYYSPNHMINDDGDRMIESVSKTGTEWTWEASICSRNIPDGPIELHYVAFDEAGNYSVGVVGNVDYTTFQGYSTDDKSDPHLQPSAYAYDSAKPAFVSNNRPRIAGVTFGTDYNGNGTIEIEEKITAYRAHQTKAEYDADNGDNVQGIKSLTGFTGADKAIYDPSGKQYKYPGRKAVQLTTDLTLDVKADMTVRGYTEITPEIVGGNGEIYYQYDLSGIGTGVNTTAFIASGTTDYTIAEGTIKLQFGDILKLSGAAESVKELSFRFWDSTEGAAALTTIQPLPIDPTAADIAAVGRQSAKLKVKMKFAGKTPATPTSTIQPFYWNSENNNSLFGNSKENGHIEVENGLPAAFTGSTGVMDRDPKVSGQIVMRGTAHDDRFIEGLYISVPGMESVFTSAGLTTTKTVDSVTYYRIADGSSGHLTGTDKWSDGFKFEVSDEKIGKGGHDAKWTFSWDTSKISDVAKADVEVHVLAYNKGTPSVDGTTHYAAATYNNPIGSAPGTTQTTTGTLTNRYRMDVVPYITSVSRNSTYNTNRARSGAIPLLREETGNTLTGFNFAAGSGTSLKITEHKNGTGSAVTVGPLSLSGSSFTFKVPDTAKDGYLHLVVNNVPALNNMNGYVESNKEKSDTYGTAKHSDDRLVHIWRVNKEDTFKGSKNAIYPAMSKGADGTLYASFSNYSKSQVYYSSAFTGNSAVAVGGTGTTKVFTGYDPPEETDITVSGTEVNVLYAANYHGGRDEFWGDGFTFDWNDTSPTAAGGIYLYDKDATNTLVGNGNSAKIYRFELFTYDNELQQFKNIRTVRSGNNIYVVYYDRLSGAVKFAWVDDSKTPNTSVNALPWCVIDGNPDVTDTHGTVPDHPADSFTFVSPDGSTYASPYVLSNFEDSLSVSNAVWESIAVATTKDGYPVVVYMDSATGGLRLARSTSKQPKSSSDWTIQKVLASSDPNGRLASNYIRAGIGTDGYLHIAFQNTKGQLVYVKSTNTSDNGSTKYAFGTSEVLDDSGMSIDMTMNGATPYISYVSRPNSYDAIRIAYKTSMDFNNTGTDVEGWETMTAPLNERAAHSRICIETQAKYYNTAEKMPVAVGFTTGSDYRAAFYVGK